MPSGPTNLTNERIWRAVANDFNRISPISFTPAQTVAIGAVAAVLAVFSMFLPSSGLTVAYLFSSLVITPVFVLIILLDQEQDNPYYQIWNLLTLRETVTVALLFLCGHQYITIVAEMVFGQTAAALGFLGWLGLLGLPWLVEGGIRYVALAREARSKEPTPAVQARDQSEIPPEMKLRYSTHSLTPDDIDSRDHLLTLVDSLRDRFQSGSFSESQFRRRMGELASVAPTVGVDRDRIENEMSRVIEAEQVSVVPDESCPLCGSARVLLDDATEFQYICAACDQRFDDLSWTVECPHCQHDSARHVESSANTHYCTHCDTMFDENRRERIERLEQGKPVSSSSIEEMVEAEYDNVDVFRVVNEGPVAYVGAKKGRFLSKKYLVLEVDVIDGAVVSEDTFSGSNGKKQAQKKLDSIEGVSVDRSDGKSLLEAWAEYEELDRKLFVDESKVGPNSGRSRGKLSDRLIGAGKKASDVGGGDWFDSPRCPYCGSQKVGQENENAYQCRNCGKMIHTGVDISWDLADDS